ncbi:MAG: homocysteine S-methyltransferase family protein [Geminicoccaceae bacterium]
MGYAEVKRRLDAGGVVILDGGTGTELERRGVPMDPNAWCGPATLEHLDVLEAIHLDYIEAGADVVTANTYASSRLMLGPAGFGDQLEEINQAAIRAAQRARAASGQVEVLVAGSLSQAAPVVQGSAKSDLSRAPSEADMAFAFDEMASLHRDEGCDLILLEMMYRPERLALALQAAVRTGLPVWVGLSVRRGADGRILSFAHEQDIPFEDLLQVLSDFEVAAAGVMHSPSDLISESIAILREGFDGPLLAYPDSGYFKMPHWQFEDVIRPDDFRRFASEWVANGVQIIGGCCGLSPGHIAAIAPLKL